MSDFDCWVYHETEKPRIVKSSEVESLESEGWKDSPAYFIKTTDFGIDPDDAAGVQVLGEAIEGVKNAANGALNIGKMDKDQLESYASEHFGVDLDKRKRVTTLRKEAEELINAEYVEV